MPFRRTSIVALIVVAASGCGHSHVAIHPPVRIPDVGSQMTTTTVDARAVVKWTRAADIQRVRDAAALIKIERAVERAKNARGPAALVAGANKSSEANQGPPPVRTATSASSGGCFSQPYVPAWIIRRESGGDPTIVNGGGHAASPYLSGGRSWGCFQFMPGTWDRNCRDLGFGVSDQIECARRVSNNGTNLGPWSL